MTVQIALMLVLLGGLLVLLGTEWLPVDVSALVGLIGLVVLGLLRPEEALSGFASEIIVMLACIFVIIGTLSRSGITQQLARLLLRLAAGRRRLAPTLMVSAAVFSAFFSNTSTTAMLVPVTMRLSRKTQVQPSQLLMPLAFASILGGTCTLIGTSTNLASAGLIRRLGLEPYSLFEFVIPGSILVVIGLLYMGLIGRYIIPQREKDTLIQDYEVPDYQSELLIGADSPAVGDALRSLELEEREIEALTVIRGGRRVSAHGNRKLEAGDRIIVRGSREALLRARDSSRYSIEAESTLTELEAADDSGIGEVILMPLSRLVGKTLKDIDFAARYELVVLAIYRRGHAYPTRISKLSLQVGDVLLLQGAKSSLARLAADPDLSVLTPIADIPLGARKGFYTLGALVGAIALVSFGLLPMSIAFLSAVVFLVLTRCTTMEEAYASIEWRLLILIGGMSAFGIAMQQTGTASFLAEWLVRSVAPFGLHATLAALALLTVALTQPMSNAAAALVVLPVAVSSAQLLGSDPLPFAVMVTLSASLSFITPLEPASLIVYGLGRYRFSDFVRVGLPLTLIVIAVLVFTVPVLWPA